MAQSNVGGSWGGATIYNAIMSHTCMFIQVIRYEYIIYIQVIQHKYFIQLGFKYAGILHDASLFGCYVKYHLNLSNKYVSCITYHLHS